jgi:signal transduction histidine kinase/ActR/RegA family two-component response regulator
MSSLASSQALRVAGGAALVCVGCYLGSKLDIRLQFPGVGAAIFFIPYAIVTIALVRARPRNWWLFLLAASVGDFLPHRQIGASVSFVLLAELANHVRAVIAAAGLQRFAGWRVRLESLGELVTFLVFVVFLGPIVGALAGAALVIWHQSDNNFWVVWQAWFSSNALTGLTLLPLLMLYPRQVRPVLRRPALRFVEASLLLLGLLAAGLGVFMVRYAHSGPHPSRLYWPLPFLLWAAARFGPRGTSAALLAVTALSIWGALERLGPFATASPTENLLDLQLFLLAVSVPFLLFSALVQQQQRSALVLAESRRKDEFLAMVGHELRNPLAPMGLALEIMRQAPPKSAEGTWAVEAMERQLRQLTRLVDDLLDIPRMSTGRIRLRLEPVDLSSVVAQAVETTRPLIDAARHQLVVSVSEALPRLHADAARLTQVIANLLNNAARYTEPGGRIELAAETEPGGLRLRVTDNGIGIPADELKTIFDLYHQAPAAREVPHGGLGIGLTLARSLVELHGGRMEALSEGEGRGSEFVVHLPLTPVPGESGALPALAAGEENGSLRILAVDDNVDAIHGLAHVLSRWGHTVRTAHDGAAALEVASSFAPQVVLLDLRLPKIDGVEVANRIRRITEPAPALFVSMSGSGPEKSWRGGVASFHHHLVKPIDMNHLRSLLDAVARDAGESPGARPT